jgi:hypothetical protein
LIVRHSEYEEPTFIELASQRMFNLFNKRLGKRKTIGVNYDFLSNLIPIAHDVYIIIAIQNTGEEKTVLQAKTQNAVEYSTKNSNDYNEIIVESDTITTVLLDSPSDYKENKEILINMIRSNDDNTLIYWKLGLSNNYVKFNNDQLTFQADDSFNKNDNKITRLPRRNFLKYISFYSENNKDSIFLKGLNTPSNTKFRYLCV